jgi:hypothetical protein
MHSLRTIIKINQPVAEPTRNDISSQAKWVLSLLNISERSFFPPLAGYLICSASS